MKSNKLLQPLLQVSSAAVVVAAAAADDDDSDADDEACRTRKLWLLSDTGAPPPSSHPPESSLLSCDPHEKKEEETQFLFQMLYHQHPFLQHPIMMTGDFATTTHSICKLIVIIIPHYPTPHIASRESRV
jgi:hypothetical protein